MVAFLITTIIIIHIYSVTDSVLDVRKQHVYDTILALRAHSAVGKAYQ